MPEQKQSEEEFSFKSYFVPLTTLKAINWIIVIGIIIFCNGLFNNFVGDDLGQIVNNPAVQSFANIPKFFLGGTFYNGNNAILTGTYYRPILSSAYTIIYTLFGLTPFAFHSFQLLIHITNAIFVFLIFRFFLKKISRLY